jgi:non-ribosomal peptide synthetase component F
MNTDALADAVDRYALSPLQQSMLDECVAAPAGSRIGLLQVVCDLPEPMDAAAFRKAWNQVASRHAILRTRIVWGGGGGQTGACQEIVRRTAVPLTDLDVTAVPAMCQENLLQDWLLEDRRRGLDLTRAPLLRVMLVRLNPLHHQAVVTIHHLLFDGRTVLALVQEVFAAYEARRRGEPLALPPAPQYRAYIDWLATRDRDAARAFWQRSLSGVRAPTSLGIERAAVRQEAAAAAVWLYDDIAVWLTAAATASLAQLARDLDVTLNTLLLCAWALVLSRYSAQPDVLFGVVRTHRGAMPGGAAILGPMMCSMPLRVEVPPAAAVGEWLREVRSRWLAMRAADFVSPAAIRGWSELDPQAPFFETLVLFETHELNERLRQGGPDWRRRTFRLTRQSRVPLSVYGYLEERMSLKLIWDPKRFARPAMQRLLEQLRTVLEALPAAAGAGRSVAGLPLVAPIERHQLLVEWNDTAWNALPPPDDGGDPAARRTEAHRVPVHRQFAAQARRTPRALAVADGTRRWTYGEVDAGADRLARILGGSGVGPGVVVAVHLERSALETLVLLAVLRAGGAYLPLEPGAPRERLQAILADARPAALVTRRELARQLATGGRLTEQRVVEVDGLAELVTAGAGQVEAALPAAPAAPDDAASRGAALEEVSPDQPAYMIYTSGSTGRPKGVVVPHRGLSNLAAWHAEAFGVTAADRASRLAGLAFDASVWELWPYWCRGAAVLLPPEETRLSPGALRQWLEREAVSVAFVPTPVAERLLAEEWPAAARLRLLLTGGDALHGRPAAGLPFRVINNYGPTESSVVATSGAVAVAPATVGGAMTGVGAAGPGAGAETGVAPGLAAASINGIAAAAPAGAGMAGVTTGPAAGAEGPPAIGRPIRGVRVHLLNGDLLPVPMGVRGEVFLAGRGLAQGYHGRPERTAESFLPDPFVGSCGQGDGDGSAAAGGVSARPPGSALAGGGRLYRTGDLARFLPDGRLEFLGRRDSQLKLRGFRIEPGEIEAALCRHPAVRECAVVAHDGGAGAAGGGRAAGGASDAGGHGDAGGPSETGGAHGEVGEERGGSRDGGAERRLVAHLTARAGSRPDAPSAGELRAFLEDKLPPYMIPAVFSWLDALPLTANGKVDRRTLAAAPLAAEERAHRQAAPGTPLEKLLAGIWRRVLGCAHVAADDDFFALGGHSLKAMQVVAELREIFQCDFTPDLVFLAPTISRLAAELFPGEEERQLAERVAELTLGGAAETAAAELVDATVAGGSRAG